MDDATTQLEFGKLQRIALEVTKVEERLNERLPSQRQHLLAFLSYMKWKVKALKVSTNADLEGIQKHIRLEVGALDYRVKEQAEVLTRCLCDLDNILSNGNNELRDARKALVVRIQSVLMVADTLRVQSETLRSFCDGILETMASRDVTFPTNENHQKVDIADTLVNEALEENAIRTDDPKAIDQELSEPEQPEEEEKEIAEITELPVWKPYYYVQQRPDGLYLIAKLRGVHPQQLHVRCLGDSGVICIEGVKYPSAFDVNMTRLTGKPTFGRFEITTQLPVHLVDMEQATQSMQANGELIVRLPYYRVHPPRRLRASRHLPAHCMVW